MLYDKIDNNNELETIKFHKYENSWNFYQYYTYHPLVVSRPFPPHRQHAFPHTPISPAVCNLHHMSQLKWLGIAWSDRIELYIICTYVLDLLTYILYKLSLYGSSMYIFLLIEAQIITYPDVSHNLGPCSSPFQSFFISTKYAIVKSKFLEFSITSNLHASLNCCFSLLNNYVHLTDIPYQLLCAS